VAVAATTATGARPVRAGRRPPLAWIGTVPFLGYVGVFLLLPTGIVIWNAVRGPTGGFDLSSLKLLGNSAVRSYFIGSVELSAVTSVIGAMVGAVVAYAVASGNPEGVVRRLCLAGSGVLAQFGGVTLAFAFNAAVGPTSGFLMHASWYYDFPQGIALIYVYFQIPLMVLVFLPAIDGLKIQWREASENLGGSTWQYWRHVGGPLLAPAFIGATLLLFANALSAYATIQAWENQIRCLYGAAADLHRDHQRGRARVQRGGCARPWHGDHGRHHHDGICPTAAQGGTMAAVTSLGEAPLDAPANRQRGMQASRRRRLNLFRYLVFLVFALFTFLPLLAMVRFSLEGSKLGTWSVAAWQQIVSYQSASSGSLLSAIEVTMELAAITRVVVLVLLVPTMIWIRLRVQWISRAFEFLCLLPLTIPAIVIVVGLGPVYNKIEHYSLSVLQLFWVYVILALPYAYRALAAGLNAIDVRTLAEAARSLGASWGTVMLRVIAPNMWQAILNALLLSSALVLGEFTIAEILNYVNLQVALFNISRETANAGVLFSTSSASLMFAFLLLLILSYVGRRRRRRG
jgi:putative spermidine/putrescine transport system permease protein